MAIPASATLIWHAGVRGGVIVYAVALVCLYAVSAAYHIFSWSSKARLRWRKLDHAMIYLFIVSSMTPYCLLGVPGTLADVVLAVGWLGAAAAVLAIVFRFETTRRLVSAGYIVLGWLVVVTLPQAFSRLSAVQLGLLGAMGFLYTAGAVVLATRWPDPHPTVFGYHEVWHTMVVVASASYFVVVWTLVGGRG